MSDTQPAGEHHVGSLALSGEGNAPAGVPISDDVVLQAARAACEHVYPPKTHKAWEDVDDFERDAWCSTASVVLEAAHPAIRQQVAEEIAAAIDAGEDRANEASKREGIAGNRGTSRAWDDIATGYMRSAELAREIGGKA